MIARITTVVLILSIWFWICLSAITVPGSAPDPIIQEDGYTKGA